jgi:hypothetical protein
MEMPPLNGVKSKLSYHNLMELPKIHVVKNVLTIESTFIHAY